VVGEWHSTRAGPLVVSAGQDKGRRRPTLVLVPQRKKMIASGSLWLFFMADDSSVMCSSRWRPSRPQGRSLGWVEAWRWGSSDGGGVLREVGQSTSSSSGGARASVGEGKEHLALPSR
jgi:hypothetical protein